LENRRINKRFDRLTTESLHVFKFQDGKARESDTGSVGEFVRVLYVLLDGLAQFRQRLGVQTNHQSFGRRRAEDFVE
jgi:hypothetical protein